MGLLMAPIYLIRFDPVEPIGEDGLGFVDLLTEAGKLSEISCHKQLSRHQIINLQ
jgi:hypothetical protein